MLSSYFNAINTHNYQAFIALLTSQNQQQWTPGRFKSGYASTKDSAETLQTLQTASGNSLVATVSFTSHQNPADSVNGAESCTAWTISLYLESQASGYLIGQPPTSYPVQDAAC